MQHTHTYQQTRQQAAAYNMFLANMQGRFDDYVARSGGKLFFAEPPRQHDGTDVDLFDLYLSPLEGELRQYHTCSACRHFVHRYGNLVHVEADGSATPVLWDPNYAPEELRVGVSYVQSVLYGAKVNKHLVTSETALGTPEDGGWTHMAVRTPNSMRYTGRVKTAGQTAALAKEEAGMLVHAVGEFDDSLLSNAIALLRSGAVTRSDKFVAPVEWLQSVARRVAGVAQINKRNLLWKESVTAPTGFTHIRASAVGTLLKNLKDGMDATRALREFDAITNPFVYQRPVAAPRRGNVERAEEVIDKLGLKLSLERRMATMDDVKTFWSPRAAPAAEAKGGVFDHLIPAARPVDLTNRVAVDITWEKFARMVLPNASAIELIVPPEPLHFTALTTAVHPTAPPLLAWDRDDSRNPVAWYRYVGGTTGMNWGLTLGQAVEVTGICRKPPLWNNETSTFGDGVILLLKGARDRGSKSLGLFPEFLRSDLREVRSTLAAYSTSKDLAASVNDVAGVMVDATKTNPVPLMVTVGNLRQVYKIDRWD